MSFRRGGLGGPVRLAGRGLHGGTEASVWLQPAAAGSGRRFRRRDRPAEPAVLAGVDAVVSTERSTRLGRGDATVDTVEHLLAALVLTGVDDVLVEVDGPEIPILDGSAQPFVEAIERVGVRLGAPEDPVRVAAPVEVREGDRWARLEPADELGVDVEVDYPRVGRQRFRAEGLGALRDGLASARTFGFVEEEEALRSAGRALGADLSSVVVFGPDGVLNPEGLRFADEVVRHKALDAVGDLALARGRLCARYVAHRPGHALNVALVRAWEKSR